MNSTALGIYAQAGFGAFEASATAWRASNKIKTQRTVMFGGLTEGPESSYDGDTTAAALRLGYRFDLQRGSIVPYIEGAHVRVGTDAFAESGGGTALRVNNEDDRSTLLTAGLQWSVQLGRGNTQLYGDAGWTQAVGDEDASASTMQFASSNVPFAVRGVQGARDAFHVDGGIQWQLAPNLLMRAGVQARWGKDTKSQAGHIGIDWKF